MGIFKSGPFSSFEITLRRSENELLYFSEEERKLRFISSYISVFFVVNGFGKSIIFRLT